MYIYTPPYIRQRWRHFRGIGSMLKNKMSWQKSCHPGIVAVLKQSLYNFSKITFSSTRELNLRLRKLSTRRRKQCKRWGKNPIVQDISTKNLLFEMGDPTRRARIVIVIVIMLIPRNWALARTRAHFFKTSRSQIVAVIIIFIAIGMCTRKNCRHCCCHCHWIEASKIDMYF